MITYQRIILKTFKSISNHINQFNSINAYSFTSQDNKHYQYPFNFNRQQHKSYIKKVQKAKIQIAAIQQLQQGQSIPRRKRRVYDRPKHDTNLTGYSAWRLYDPQETQFKLFQHSMPVVSKLSLQPKWLIHAFGYGILPINNRLSSHRQYVFEDNNLSKYVLYEYRNTTFYKQNIPDYDYDNQQHLRPEMTKIKRLDPKDFWQSENKFEFRLNCTSYAQHLKFGKWLELQIQQRKSKESYDQIINKKFGKSNCFNQKADAELFQPRTPFIMHVSSQLFQVPKRDQKQKQKPSGKGKKEKKGVEVAVQKPVVQKTVVVEKPIESKPAYNFSYKLDEKYRKQVKAQQLKKATRSNEL